MHLRKRKRDLEEEMDAPDEKEERGLEEEIDAPEEKEQRGLEEEWMHLRIKKWGK
jgi:hypothetical protein